jgi:hypothetical protein
MPTGIKQIVDAELEGRVRSWQWRKTPSAVTTAGIWFDLATAAGNPKAKNWFDAAPLTAQQIKQSTDGGIFHGADVSPSTKYLRKSLSFTATATALPMQMRLCDYLIYYPTIDDATTDEQIMDNTTTLPRYTDGKGVQMMAITLAGRTGGQTFTVKYTNQDGVTGRISETVVQNTSGVIGTITTSTLTPTTGSVAPFIGLQSGDTGVRAVESVTMNGVDTGLFAIVLVKPIFETQIRGIDAPVEKDLLLHSVELPRIYDDAFLNYLCLPNGSLAATALIGNLKFIWN